MLDDEVNTTEPPWQKEVEPEAVIVGKTPNCELYGSIQ